MCLHAAHALILRIIARARAAVNAQGFFRQRARFFYHKCMLHFCVSIVLMGSLLFVCSCEGNATASASPAPQPILTTQPTPYVVNGNAESTVEQAHARLQ